MLSSFVRIKYILIIFSLAFSSGLMFTCAEIENYQEPELIEIWKIEPGQTTELDMEKVIFLKSYDLEFDENEYFSIDYKTKENSLEVTPKKNFTGLKFVRFRNSGREYLLPILVEKKIPMTFEYNPDKPVSEVYLMGNFNTWQRNDIPMTDSDGDGTYNTTIKLNKGVYKYQFVVDNNEIWDPVNPDKIPNGFGSYNSIVRVKDPQGGKNP